MKQQFDKAKDVVESKPDLPLVFVTFTLRQGNFSIPQSFNNIKPITINSIKRANRPRKKQSWDGLDLDMYLGSVDITKSGYPHSHAIIRLNENKDIEQIHDQLYESANTFVYKNLEKDIPNKFHIKNQLVGVHVEEVKDAIQCVKYVIVRHENPIKKSHLFPDGYRSIFSSRTQELPSIENNASILDCEGYRVELSTSYPIS